MRKTVIAVVALFVSWAADAYSERQSELKLKPS